MPKVRPGTITVPRRIRIIPVWKGFSNGNTRDAERTQLQHNTWTQTAASKKENA